MWANPPERAWAGRMRMKPETGAEARIGACTAMLNNQNPAGQFLQGSYLLNRGMRPASRVVWE